MARGSQLKVIIVVRRPPIKPKMCWRWSWQSEKEKDGIDWSKKTYIAGMCFCIVIRYGTTGKKSLRLHCEDKKHIKNI